MMNVLINATLYDFQTLKKNAYIRFNQTIQDIGDMHDFKARASDTIYDAKDHLIMPGLIAGHTHIYSTFARGLALEFNPHNFQEILDQLWWRIDRALDKDMVYHSGIVSATDAVKNGITTMIDHHASGTDIVGTLNALKRAVVDTVGLRGAFAFETSDRFNITQCIKENVDFFEKNKTSESRGLFGLHASMSLSEETLKNVKKVLGTIPIHMHVAESQMDQEDSIQKYHEPVVHRLARHGLLNPNSILVHALYVNDQELDLMKKHQVQVALNVTSNMNNAVGLPDVMKFIEKDIPLILGNDGISSAMTTEYLMLYYAMHLKTQSPTVFGLDDLRKIIINTYNYASRLFGTRLGQLQPGFQADILSIPYVPPTPIKDTNAFGHVFFGLFQSFKPSDVWIKGKKRVQQYRVDENLELAYKKAQHSAKTLWQKLEKEGDKNDT